MYTAGGPGDGKHESEDTDETEDDADDGEAPNESNDDVVEIEEGEGEVGCARLSAPPPGGAVRNDWPRCTAYCGGDCSVACRGSSARVRMDRRSSAGMTGIGDAGYPWSCAEVNQADVIEWVVERPPPTRRVKLR